GKPALSRAIAGRPERGLAALCSAPREGEGECRPLALLAFDGQLALHRAYQVPTDREPETGSLLGRGQTPADLHERLEDVPQMRRGDADPAVANGHRDRS